MHVDVSRDREREREVRPGRWVAEARAEAARRKKLPLPISQMKLAVLIGRDRNTVSRWEVEDGEVDYVVWLGVLYALGLPIDYEPASTPAPSPPGPRPSATAAAAAKRGSGRKASTSKGRQH